MTQIAEEMEEQKYVGQDGKSQDHHQLCATLNIKLQVS